MAKKKELAKKVSDKQLAINECIDVMQDALDNLYEMGVNDGYDQAELEAYKKEKE